MEKYIINFEDGKSYIADNYTESDVDAMNDGYLSIVRASDCKMLTYDNKWVDLPKWEQQQ